MLTVEDAAQLLDLSVRQVFNLLDDEADPLPAIRGGKKVAVQIEPRDFGKWLERRWTGTDYTAERTRLTKAQADKAEIEVAEKRGEVLKTTLAVLTVQSMCVAMRSKLLSIPTKLAPQLADTPQEIVKVQELLRSAVHEALTEVSSDRFHDEVEAAAAAIIARDAGDGTTPEPNGKRVGGRKTPAKQRKQRGAGAVAN